MIDLIKWHFVAVVLFADILIVKKNYLGFYLWVVTDGFFAINSYLENRFAEAVIFGLYALIGIYGVRSWKKDV